MEFVDISDWWANLDEENAIEAQIINRIGSYIDNAESQVPNNDLRKSLFFNQLYLDRDAYRLLMSHNPDWKTEVQSLVYGKPFNWQPEQVAQLMGVKDPVKLFQKDENGLPHWKKLAGGENSSPEEMSKFLDEYYGFEDESPKAKGKLYKWLEAGQKQYDNKAKYTGGAVNATRGLFAPRVQESLQQYGDYDWKDVAGDVGENIAQAFPWARGAADLGKAILGARALGKVSRPALRTGEYLASNTAAPLWGEAYDAIAYNDLENPNRSRFDVGDVLGGSATNMATAPMIGTLASTAARTSGIDGIGRRTVRDVLTSDPYVTAVHRMQELGSGAPFSIKYSPSQLDLEGEVYGKVFGYPVRKVKKAGKAQRDKWESDLGIKNITTGDLNTDYALIKRKIEDPETPRENIPVLENIKEKMKTMILQGGNRPQKSYESFLKNREHMTPTAILEAQGLGGKYGASGDNIADVAFFANNPSETHGLSSVVKPKDSASSLKKAKMQSANVDKKYPVVETDFDKAVYNLENKPDVVEFAKRGSVVRPVLTGFTTNKLGKQEYGEKLTGKNVNTTDIDEDVATFLNDDAMIKMWESGFVPRGNPDEPIMKAYAIFKSNQEKGNKRKSFGKNAGL